jgi:formylmethanofuran dehydrogenase subunit E
MRKAQTAAYRVMPEADLFKVERVAVDPSWLDRRRARVFCNTCGEGINYRRELSVDGRTLCRPCAGDSYYTRLA